MRYYTLIPTFIIGFILQLSIVNMFSIEGIAPSLILCLVLTITFLFDNEYRCVGCGLVFGLLLDVSVGKVIGVYSLTLFVVGILAITCKKYLNYENKLTVAVLAILGTLAYNVVPFLIMAVRGMNVSILRVIGFLPWAMLLNIVVMYILYFLMIKRAKARVTRTMYERYEII